MKLHLVHAGSGEVRRWSTKGVEVVDISGSGAADGVTPAVHSKPVKNKELQYAGVGEKVTGLNHRCFD